MRSRAFEGDVCSTLIANRANSPEVAGVISSAEGFVDDMAEVETGSSRGVFRVRFTGNSTAHLASESMVFLL